MSADTKTAPLAVPPSADTRSEARAQSGTAAEALAFLRARGVGVETPEDRAAARAARGGARPDLVAAHDGHVTKQPAVAANKVGSKFQESTPGIFPGEHAWIGGHSPCRVPRAAGRAAVGPRTGLVEWLRSAPVATLLQLCWMLLQLRSPEPLWLSHAPVRSAARASGGSSG